MRGNHFDIGRMIAGRRAQDRQIGFQGQTGRDIGEHPFGRNAEVRNRIGHARRVAVADPQNFRPRMVLHLPQQVAHMHVIKVDPDDTKALGHGPSPKTICPTIGPPGRCAKQIWQPDSGNFDLVTRPRKCLPFPKPPDFEAKPGAKKTQAPTAHFRQS